MEYKHNILLVEDDESLGYLLSEYLKMKGLDVNWVQDGTKVMDALSQNLFDLIVLDIMMPKVDGFTLATEIKKQYPDIPFIFLTAKSLKVDVLKGFSVGALDYLKKPIDEEELVTRIMAHLSRLGKNTFQTVEEDIMQIGLYTFDSRNNELQYDDESIRLTARENELLKFLVANKNNLCSHKDILVRIWGNNDYFNRKSLNVFITHLRKHLEKDPSLKIENVHGRGFVLKTQE
ncbi:MULTISPECIES: response regulator transcription factor [Flavobacteriaceae]|uniref:response regulator transcription factor n=1 Tax=Flavobacteriaceae TaxID=49546 RepID=UPI001491492E|nr:MULTISPECIES: response regulator transcription factor [Allomuricauda]MDC6367055.1 response regulator transcription factor [Muricauda sp. AC10]